MDANGNRATTGQQHLLQELTNAKRGNHKFWDGQFWDWRQSQNQGCRFKRDLTLHFNATVTEMEDSHEIEIEDLRRYMADKVDFLKREAAGRQTQHIAAIQRLETMYGEQELILAAAHRDIRRLVAMIAEEQRGQDGGQDGGSDGVDFGLVVDDDSDDGGIGQYFPN
eukprot:gene2420-2936_t